MNVLTPADWLARSLPDCSANWLLLSESTGPVAADIADIRDLAEMNRCDVVVCPAGLDAVTVRILNQLAPPISLIAAPIAQGDTVVLSPRAARMSVESARRESVSQLVLDLLRQGCRVTWHTNSTAPGDARRLPALVPTRPGQDERWKLDSAPGILNELLPGAHDPVGKTALRAGLLQVSDWLDESHQASQSIEHAGSCHDGDYWHAIMHRREPDYGNSKYWFRNVGTHPVFSELATHAAAMLESDRARDVAAWTGPLLRGATWDPFRFVDMCQAAAGNESSGLGVAARRIQWLEMLLLLRHCWREVSGGAT